jgi:uncharacterized glyoxalase superfamily protein PhnB
VSVFPIISSADVERSARFYEEAFGFERAFRWPLEGGKLDYVYLTRGEHGLGIGRGEAGSMGFEICIYVEDVDAVAERLRELGAEEIEPPADREWGERMGYYQDPDGHRLHVTMPK